MTTKELYQKRAKIHEDMKAIKAQAVEEKREHLNEDESKKFDAFNVDFEQLTRSIKDQELLEQREAELAGEQGKTIHEGLPKKDQGNDPKETEQRYAKVFREYCVRGLGDLSNEERTVLKAGFVSDEQRQQSTTDSAGGYMIPQGFSNELEKAMKAYGGMTEAARVYNTTTGNQVDWPTVDDTSNSSAILAENSDADASTTDVTFSRKQLDAYKTNPGVLKTSRELFQDSAFNVEQILGELMGERTGRFENQWFTTGTGSSQPNGVVTASSQGKYAAEPTETTFSEILDLLHSVDPAYRIGPKVRFMMNDNTLLQIKKLVVGSSDARPLWQPSVAVGQPDTIAGYPYSINQDMANMAASSKPILFGDFGKFIIRKVGTPYFRRLDERYADYDQIGWLLFTRVDSELIDGGGGAIKYLQMHSS
jgi:HK97 family phage major capsid protein